MLNILFSNSCFKKYYKDKNLWHFKATISMDFIIRFWNTNKQQRRCSIFNKFVSKFITLFSTYLYFVELLNSLHTFQWIELNLKSNPMSWNHLSTFLLVFSQTKVIWKRDIIHEFVWSFINHSIAHKQSSSFCLWLWSTCKLYEIRSIIICLRHFLLSSVVTNVLLPLPLLFVNSFC